MLDLGYVREHLDVIEKMARERGVTLDLRRFASWTLSGGRLSPRLSG